MPEREFSVLLRLKGAEAEQLQKLLEITGMKPTTFLRRVALDTAYFMVNESAKGSEIHCERPDGLKVELLSGILARIRTRALEDIQVSTS